MKGGSCLPELVFTDPLTTCCQLRQPLVETQYFTASRTICFFPVGLALKELPPARSSKAPIGSSNARQHAQQLPDRGSHILHQKKKCLSWGCICAGVPQNKRQCSALHSNWQLRPMPLPVRQCLKQGQVYNNWASTLRMQFQRHTLLHYMGIALSSSLRYPLLLGPLREVELPYGMTSTQCVESYSRCHQSRLPG